MSLKVLTALGGGKLGGAEAFFVSLNLALKSHGVPVHAALRDTPLHTADLARAGIPYDTLKFGGPFDVWTSRRLRRMVKHFAPDIVLTFASRASAHMPKGNYALIGRLGGYYKLRHFRKCDYLVCNAPDLVRYVVDGGWPKDRVVLIPNFPRIDEGDAIDRSVLGTPEGVPVALALGRLHRNKALDVLLRAAATIPDLWVWIAGEGVERASLEVLARDLGIAERVKFLGWRTDRASLFKAADLCVYPSREEPFGNVVVEAWAYGAPLVATAAVGPSWLVRDGKDGLLTPVDDPGALAGGILRIVSAPDFGRQLAENGKKRVAAEFSEDAVVLAYMDLFEKARRISARQG
jgi:glycosyltransferase involved in cell wall biosynthesis